MADAAAAALKPPPHRKEPLNHPLDPLFRVELLAATESPQTLCWQAMHQDYAENFVAESSYPPEDEAGASLVRHLLASDRGHYGPFEHAAITFNVGWFPHSVMQQARTHRIGISFDVQSFRYTGTRIIGVNKGLYEVDEVFYLRPAGTYTDRTGSRYEYTEAERLIDITRCSDAANHYAAQIRRGMSEEHARSLLPFDVRQHFVVSFTLRSLMHFLDLRSKLDAQLEIRALCDLIWPHFETWTPAIASWYAQKRLHKARLAP